MITIEESYELFTSTLSRLDHEKLNLNDEKLAYHIFDELDIEAHSFLHERTVDLLIEGELIHFTLKDRVLNLREAIIKLMASKHSIHEYRNDNDWQNVREEANSILNIITKKEKPIISCIECDSSFFEDSSYMKEMCPECSHHLYGYNNCSHNFEDGRCLNCFWDGSVSDYISNLKNKSEI